MLRWPGGNFSSNYHWKDGIGPRDKRPPRLEMAWGTVESNRFGTHEFLHYAEMLKTEPYICLNLGTGTWNEAQQWVEYCNSAEDTAMTRLRKQNGRAGALEGDLLGAGQRDGRPLADGPSQRGGLRQVRAGSRQADEVDRPQHQADRGRLVQLRPGRTGSAGTARCWSISSEHADYLSLHMYVGNRDNDFGDFVASSVELDDRIKTSRRHHRRGALRPEPAQPQDLHRLGRVECLVSRARRHSSAAGASWRSTTTWKTRWWWRPS